MEGDEIKIRNMLITDDDRKRKIKINNEQFIIKAPMPKERTGIARSIAYYANGIPLSSFPMADRDRFERDSFVMWCVDDGPDWWEGPDECAEDATLDELNKQIQKWDADFQSALKKNKFVKGGAKHAVPA